MPKIPSAARKMVEVTLEAHKAAFELVKVLKKEKGVTRIGLRDAASLAILEALERRKAAEKEQA